jgi:hypothetical protein
MALNAAGSLGVALRIGFLVVLVVFAIILSWFVRRGAYMAT